MKLSNVLLALCVVPTITAFTVQAPKGRMQTSVASGFSYTPGGPPNGGSTVSSQRAATPQVNIKSPNSGSTLTTPLASSGPQVNGNPNSRSIWDTATPVTVQGGSLRTWSFPSVERVQVLLKTEGRLQIYTNKMKITNTILALCLFCPAATAFSVQAPKARTGALFSSPGYSPGGQQSTGVGNPQAGATPNVPSQGVSSAPMRTTDVVAKNIWDTSTPVTVQGGSLRTWSFPSVERVQVLLKTEGRPLQANIDLWQGPDNTPQKMAIYIEDGDLRPFSAVIETPRGNNAVAVRNTGAIEFPLAACVEADVKDGSTGLVDVTKRLSQATVPHTIQGGAIKTYSYAHTVASVQLLLRSDGRPLNARIELMQGPNNNKQVIEVYTEDGNERPFFVVIETPGIRNTGAIEFPLAACVEADTGKGSAGLVEVTKRLAETSTPETIQGGAIKTFSYAATVSSVQLLLRSDGRPLNARIELMQGPNNNKQVIEVYTEDGNERPFFIIIETPGSGNVVRVINAAPVEFPMIACVEPYMVEPGHDESAQDGGKSWDSSSDGFFLTGRKQFAWGTRMVNVMKATLDVTYRKRYEVASRLFFVAVLIFIQALMQGPNNNKQVIEVYTEDGNERPFFIIIETPGSGNVVRVINAAPVEFPMVACVEPFMVEPGHQDAQDGGKSWDSGSSGFFLTGR
eukprot:CAMPEP_0119031208 /NCGR_PEP_ID=MMETSP1176-20130426/41426_1 /TAXON_ID=265551 /ORGANISM="Synedropsis recta cf, Strain CCMP1620" /LENGTH=683 /DNA_ID=CAMNT_0006987599 /DNA_START=40 /DNA_END=2092 /DNA_ORIENTATION=+